MQSDQITKEEWLHKAQEAILHFDAADAYKLLRDWTVIIKSKVTEKQEDKAVESLRKNLLFTAFALLSTELVKLVLKEYLLDFLKSGEELLDPMEKIELRIKAAGYGAYDQEREMMKKTVLENNEMIGKFSVSEWIKRFEKIAQLGDQNVINTLFTKDFEVANLGKTDQALLKILVSGYEKWLYGKVISVFDVAVMNKGNHTPRNTRRTSSANERDAISGSIISLPILQALSKYEKLGNQLITEARIRVKSQPEPVRPSLLYWLKYYRDELGVGHHDSVQRGQFLFRSENGKKLSAEEREHVSLILKSVEENFPIAVDTERQEIVFPVFHGVMISTHAEPAAIPSNAKIIRGPEFSAAPAAGQYASGGLRIGRGTHFGNLEPAKEVAPGLGEVSFSTKHLFAAEKEDAEQEKLAAQPTPQPAQSSAAPQPAAPRPAARSVAPKMNPFRIHPVSLGKKIGGTAKNVV